VTNPLGWALDRENPKRQEEDDFERWLISFAAPKGQKRAVTPL